MGDMVEKVARALWAKYSQGGPWEVLEPRQHETWCTYARAALEASCHDELVEVAKGAANCFPGHQTAVMAEAVLAKVKDEGHG